MNISDIHRVEAEISKFEEANKLAKALDRLRDNPDFKLIIETGYCTKYLDALVRSLAIVSNEANVNQTNRQIAGIGSLNHYLDTIENNGRIAESELETLYQTRVHLQTQGDVNE